MQEEWKVALKTGNLAQAEILRGLLEAQGIPARTMQEPAARAIGLQVGPFGEISIIVPESRLAEAEEVINAFFRGDFENNNNPVTD